MRLCRCAYTKALLACSVGRAELTLSCSRVHSQYEPDTDSDDEEYEDTDDEDLHWRERQRKLLQDSDEEEGGDGYSDGGGSHSSRGKRRRLDENGNEIADDAAGAARGPKRLSKRQKGIHTTRIQKYYASGTWYGQSVAGMMYTLATLLRRADNDYLW
jgi:cell division control protein 45